MSLISILALEIVTLRYEINNGRERLIIFNSEPARLLLSSLWRRLVVAFASPVPALN